MDKLMLYRQAIKNLLKEYADLSAADKEVDTQLLFGLVIYEETCRYYYVSEVVVKNRISGFPCNDSCRPSKIPTPQDPRLREAATNLICWSRSQKYKTIL